MRWFVWVLLLMSYEPSPAAPTTQPKGHPVQRGDMATTSSPYMLLCSRYQQQRGGSSEDRGVGGDLHKVRRSCTDCSDDLAPIFAPLLALNYSNGSNVIPKIVSSTAPKKMRVLHQARDIPRKCYPLKFRQICC